MKKLTQLLLVSLVVTGTLFTSCVKDEADNIEANIISATIEGAKELLIVEPTIENNLISFRLIEEPTVTVTPEEGEASTEVSYLFAPTFVLSKGATISPENGVERDFAEDQKYIVTAEDGITIKEYTVCFFVDEGVALSYSFEDVNVIETEGYKGQYHQFYTLLGNGANKIDWNSGNEGFDFLLRIFPNIVDEINPGVYPTLQTDNGYKGKGAKLQTISTGAMGAAWGSPMAAGNLFLGDFDVTKVMTPMQTTKFGQPYTYKTAPKAVTGFFKYKAGEEFVINAEEGSKLEKDAWDAYAILFEKSAKDNHLFGDHNFEDPRMVSVAKLDDAQRIETNEWTEFEIEFENVAGKSFDSNKEYMFTIVFSSSIEGAIFNGAVGSELYIDEVEIILDNE